jgi:hypothetical protein
MNTDKLSKEHRVLIAMRKVLSSIVRDTTPPAGMRHPLTEHTIEDIKHCFSLIAARERELNDDIGNSDKPRPRYADEPKTSQTVSFTKPKP